MKKSLLIIACSIAIFLTVPALAQTSQPQNNDEIINLFSQTVDNINKNPQKINEMIKQLESDPNFKNYGNTNNKADLKNIDFNNPKLIKILTDKLNNDPKYLEKVIEQYGQSKAYSSDLSKDEQIRSFLNKKTESNEEFRKELFNLLPKKEQRELENL